jgi:DNA-binding beta-propeller fold protein YncE
MKVWDKRYLLAGAVGTTVVAVLTSLSATASLASTSPTPSPVGATVACSTAIAPAPMPGHVETHFAPGLLAPFGVAFGPDGKHAFVDSLINSSAPPSGLTPGRDASGISEYSISASGLVSERVGSFPDQSLVGMAVSPNGRDLVAAGGSGASVFSVSRIEQPNSAASSWLLGTFSSRGQGAIEAAASPDGDYVFVSLENSDQLAVFNLKKAERSGFGSSDLVGYVPMGVAPVGMAISPNGRYLYATSEASTKTGTEGTLTTIDLRRAEEQPSRSVVSMVWAGCSPVRVVATRSSVYVTARESDELLEFSASHLASHPATALIGQVQVGEAPVGVALANHDRTVVIADSNRFNANGVTSNLAIVAVEKKSLQLAGYVGAGDFPRDMAVSPDGTTVVISDYGSGDVEEVDVATLP